MSSTLSGNQLTVASIDNATGVSIEYNGSEKLATTATGVDVTGVITTDGLTTSADINFGDNDKAIFGAGSDLQIYHDGTNSIIKDAGSGNLVLESNSAGVFLQKAGGEALAKFILDAQCEFYYDNAKKLATTSTGVDVTGTVTSDGLTVNGDTYLVDTTGANEILLRGSNGSGSFGASKIVASMNASGNTYGDLTFQTENAGAYKNRIKVGSNGDISFYEDTGTTAKFFWDASAESLGIGTSSPDSPITVMEASNTAINVLKSTGSSLLKVGEDGSGNATYDATLSGGHIFKGTGTERMRIDSSGNLLVGTTNSTVGVGDTDAGVSIRGDNGSFFSRNPPLTSNPVIYVNRNGNDGVIQEFLKDGSTVGSIGVDSNNLTIDNVYNTAKSGLHLAGSNVSPRQNATLADDAVDLGASTVRWKDLYLSGGVYLGGTGSANHLDDYEEGTWTPQLTTSGGQTLTIDSSYTTGTYEKVGDLIHVHTYVKLSAIPGSMSGRVRIGGLPFTSSSNYVYGDSSAATIHLTGLTSGYYADGWLGWISHNSTEVSVYYGANTSAVSSANPSHTNALTSTTQIYLSVTYRTA
jgi:hypothetical protein